MCVDEAEAKRRGWKRVDMTPVDHILALVGKLTSLQRIELENRIVDRPGVIRDQIGAWAYLNEKALFEELPKELRGHVPAFWRAVEAVCRQDERKPHKLPKCCTEGEKRAKLFFVREKKR